MDRLSFAPVIQRLSAWRTEVVECLRSGDQSALALKLALDAAVGWLDACEQYGISGAPEAVKALPFPTDYAPLGDYRVLWDAETEDRGSWQEVARASPGDLLVRLP
jgi:hypothetical protein